MLAGALLFQLSLLTGQQRDCSKDDQHCIPPPEVYPNTQEVMKEKMQNEENVQHVTRTNSGRWFSIFSEILEQAATPTRHWNHTILASR